MLRWLPENISTYGQDVDNLFYLIYWITAIVFIAVTATLIVFLIKYRYREGHKAAYIEGSDLLEIVWTAATTVIVFGLAMLSLPQWNRIKSPSKLPPAGVFSVPGGGVTVPLKFEVSAKQFNWDMIYPGPDGEFDTEEDNVEIENLLHVPVNEVINVRLTSEDVIHSFFLPNLRLKQDALPGRFINVWFEATKTGTYEIPCAELCEFGHSGMLGRLIVHSEQDYANWVKEQWPE